ncbi:MAG TPA: transposase [Ktedonobacteraceae bacterium]|nr:transposase [Ktedonobacteraceae bacterium]
MACEVETAPRLPYTDEAIGIDLGVSKLATLSTGDVIENPRHYRKAEKKLAAARACSGEKETGQSSTRDRRQGRGSPPSQDPQPTQ